MLNTWLSFWEVWSIQITPKSEEKLRVCAPAKLHIRHGHWGEAKGFAHIQGLVPLISASLTVLLWVLLKAHNDLAVVHVSVGTNPLYK